MIVVEIVQTMQTTIQPETQRSARLWTPKRVVFTPDALAEPWGQQIYQRVKGLGLSIEELPSNRLTGLRGETERETYRLAKQTLAVVKAPPSDFRLQPIPPSADWQFHLARGCPAHCQYCYLAGSLQGPPVTRVYANLPAILENLAQYERPSQPTTFEASCYTDPLSLEHLTGSLSECIRTFGTRQDGFLRWVTKFDAVEPLLGLPHNGQTRCRFSVNAEPLVKLDSGTPSVQARLQAARRLALAREEGGGGYPIGLVIAPIMHFEGWEASYSALLNEAQAALDFPCDLTFELITHRFTPGSKEVLLGWYPNTSLDLEEATRDVKRNKFGGTKYVYPRATMREMRAFFEREIAARFPQAQILYWT
jgi:spore photoproduct lyase